MKSVSLGLTIYPIKNSIAENIIPENPYVGLAFDGKNIFFISDRMELKCYDPSTSETKTLCGGFVNQTNSI